MKNKGVKRVLAMAVATVLVLETLPSVTVFAEGEGGETEPSIVETDLLGGGAEGSTPSAIQFVVDGNLQTEQAGLELTVEDTAAVSAQVVDETGAVIVDAVPVVELTDGDQFVEYADGTVTAIGAGEAVLTATYGELEAVALHITVTEKEIVTTGVVYVSEAGSDETGDGSAEKPYQTVAAAMERAEHGSTVMVSGSVLWGGDEFGTENDEKP